MWLVFCLCMIGIRWMLVGVKMFIVFMNVEFMMLNMLVMLLVVRVLMKVLDGVMFCGLLVDVCREVDCLFMGCF